ncbi:hypothetical protein B0O80DRAFT_425979 [Mortierella sp. GBAus27b]|nr:hypothetical protein B0O80DRAFT_425979 [Mortierella sp. GBAus27b]
MRKDDEPDDTIFKPWAVTGNMLKNALLTDTPNLHSNTLQNLDPYVQGAFLCVCNTPACRSDENDTIPQDFSMLYGIIPAFLRHISSIMSFVPVYFACDLQHEAIVRAHPTILTTDQSCPSINDVAIHPSQAIRDTSKESPLEVGHTHKSAP